MSMCKLFVIILLFFNVVIAKIYDLKNEPMDLVMPCHKKDLPTLDLCIEAAKQNISNIRRIIVVSDERLTNNAEWFDEANYPFSKFDVAFEIFQDRALAEEYIKNPKHRAGWIFKQLMNFYHMRVIPELSSNVLVIDCDTIFLRPVKFMDEFGNGLYAVGEEYYKPYFDHAERCLPGFKKIFEGYSGICHHMLFQKGIMDDLLETLEKNGNTEAWKVLCRNIDLEEIWDAPMADYEIYFNFAFANTDQLKIRNLNWSNAGGRINTKVYKKNELDFVSFHEHMRHMRVKRKRPKPKKRLYYIEKLR